MGLGLGATGSACARASPTAPSTSSPPRRAAPGLSAEVAHRFSPGSTVRPVIGASFDRWQIEPDGREGAARSARGAAASRSTTTSTPARRSCFGADLAYHRILSSVDNASVLPDVLTFGATADIRL